MDTQRVVKFKKPLALQWRFERVMIPNDWHIKRSEYIVSATAGSRAATITHIHYAFGLEYL